MADTDQLPLPDPSALQGLMALQNSPSALQQGLAMPAPNAAPPAQAAPVAPDVAQTPPPTPSVPLDMGSGGSSQQQQQPPKQSAVPALAGFLQQMIKGPGYASAPAGQPGRPISRLDSFENFLGNFLNSFSQGMSNAGTGPAANARGFGAAVQAPYQRELQQYGLQQQQQQVQAQVAQQQAETERTRAQAQLTPVTMNGVTSYLPAEMAKSILQAQVQGQSRVQAAATQKRFVPTQFGVFDSQKGEMTGGSTSGGIGATVKMTQDMADSGDFGPGADQLVGKDVKLTDLNGMQRSTAQGYVIAQGENGPAREQKVGATGNLGLGNPGLGRPVTVGDPNSPGGTTFATGGQAVRGGLPGAASASVTVPAAVAKDAAMGTIGKTLNSLNTATEHLKLLSGLADALDNGTVPLINSFSNQYATATGDPRPTNFNMAKQAVAGEIAKTFKGQATEGEIASINSTLNAAQSPAQLKGAINTAMGLLASKTSALQQQVTQGMQGKPAFPGTGKGALTAEEAQGYLTRAGGNKDTARKMAKADGRTF